MQQLGCPIPFDSADSLTILCTSRVIVRSVTIDEVTEDLTRSGSVGRAHVQGELLGAALHFHVDGLRIA